MSGPGYRDSKRYEMREPTHSSFAEGHDGGLKNVDLDRPFPPGSGRLLPMRHVAFVVLFALSLSACIDPGKRECQQQLAANAERIRELEEVKSKLEAQNAEQARKIDALLAQLVAANDEVTRCTLQKRLEAARADAERLKKGGRPACTCQASDPLCSCL